MTSRPPPNSRARPRNPAWARTRAHGLRQIRSAGGRGPAQRPGLERQRLAGAARGAPESARLPAWTAGHGGAESSAGGARVTDSVRRALQVLRRQAGRAVNPGESLVKDEPLGVLGRRREAASRDALLQRIRTQPQPVGVVCVLCAKRVRVAQNRRSVIRDGRRAVVLGGATGFLRVKYLAFQEVRTLGLISWSFLD